jgi:glyoxylase I family protein
VASYGIFQEDEMSVDRRKLLQFFSIAVGSSVIASRNDVALAAQSGGQAASPAPAAAPAAQAAPTMPTERVAGIGGFFFRAKDPKALGDWYLANLGIPLSPTAMDSPVWKQEAGITIFTPFPETTKYFGDPQKVWMLNFRVHDMDKMVAQLHAAGIEVKLYPSGDPSQGKFARLHDPEGNPIELWQPA